MKTSSSNHWFSNMFKGFCCQFQGGYPADFFGGKAPEAPKMDDGWLRCFPFRMVFWHLRTVSFRKGTSYKHWTYIYSQRYAQVLTFWYTKKRSLKNKNGSRVFTLFSPPKKKTSRIAGAESDASLIFPSTCSTFPMFPVRGLLHGTLFLSILAPPLLSGCFRKLPFLQPKLGKY